MGEWDDDSLLVASFFEETTGDKSFLVIVVLGDRDDRFVFIFTLGDAESILSKDCCGIDGGGGDSLGDLILIAASSRVRGRAGDGDLLDTGD